MSASPRPAPDSSAITVAPASLSSVGATLAALAGEVRVQASRAPAADAVGDGRCHAALATASDLVGAAVTASAAALDELARSLHAAASAYTLADLLAFTPQGR